MNSALPNDDILFDRLVDGEISAAERRELLESLDSRPGGWRQCALAFMWTSVMAVIHREAI